MTVLSLLVLRVVPFLCVIATSSRFWILTATAQPVVISGDGMLALGEGQLAEIELRRQAKQSSNLDCEQVRVLLTTANVAAGQSSELTGAPKFGDRQGGSIVLLEPGLNNTMTDTIVGDYSYFITFLNGNVGNYGCLATGAYTFVSPDSGNKTFFDQVTFTASCSGLPFFSITGGRGKYSGAEGFVEFRIPVADGFIHEINICSFHDNKQPGKKSKSSKSNNKRK